jgi:hypothetical protein
MPAGAPDVGTGEAGTFDEGRAAKRALADWLRKAAGAGSRV